MDSLLNVENLSKWYIDKNQKTIKAVNGVSFSLQKGEVIGIIGESGCGKSTLGRLLVGLEKPTDGNIDFDGSPINNVLKNHSLQFRRNCQMIFQNPFDTFDPRNSIKTILTTALKIHGIGNSEEERVNHIIEAMENTGISPGIDYLHRYPHELSGGQLQRISILRSMLLNPKLIIADEPVSMLDVSVRADIMNMLLQLTKEQDTGLVFISHDIATTRHISDIIGVMYLGKIVEIGRTDDIVHNPQHPYTKVLLSNCVSIDSFNKSNVISIIGEPTMPIDSKEVCYFAPRCYKSNPKCSESYPKMIEIGDEHYVSCFYLGGDE